MARGHEMSVSRGPGCRSDRINLIIFMVKNQGKKSEYFGAKGCVVFGFDLVMHNGGRLCRPRRGLSACISWGLRREIAVMETLDFVQRGLGVTLWEKNWARVRDCH